MLERQKIGRERVQCNRGAEPGKQPGTVLVSALPSASLHDPKEEFGRMVATGKQGPVSRESAG